MNPELFIRTRYEIKAVEHTFEVDEFYGDNNGLVVAKVNLNQRARYLLRHWLGEEVTGDARYYNSMLMKNPYTKW